MDKGIPEWATQTFNNFIDHSKQLNDLLHLSIRGIGLLPGMPALVKALDESAAEKAGVAISERLKVAQSLALLADSELQNGFPLLHSQHVVSLWSAIEVLVRDFLAQWIQHVPEAKASQELKKLKIQLGDYELFSSEERSHYILDLLEDSIGSRRLLGLGRFERLFNLFGLSSDLDEDLRKNFHEFYHVRNLLVHRRGIADRKTIERCPWMKIKANEPVVISHSDYQRYSSAVNGYVLALIRRVGVHFRPDRHISEDAPNTRETTE